MRLVFPGQIGSKLKLSGFICLIFNHLNAFVIESVSNSQHVIDLC
jgi:hypothetical protein